MAEIEKCLEQHAVLSTSWLSNELQISVRAAIDLMQQYRESVEGIIAMYRLSSKSASGCFRIEIVSEQDLDKRRDESMLHHQLYCIQRSRSDMTKSKLVEVSLLQAEELLNTSTATNGSFLDNAFGGVKVNGLDIKAVGDRIFSSQNLSFDAAAAKAAASSVAAFQPPVVNKPLSGSTLSLGRSSNLTSKPAASTTVAKSKPVSSSATLKKIDEKNAEIAKRFFAATESKPKTETEEMDTSGAGAGDDDEEWDDGAPKRFVTKKPKAVVNEDEMDLGALDNFENTKEPDSNAMDVEEDEVDSSQPEQEGKSHGKKKPKVDVLKRGAMDDYMEDAAIDEHKRKQAEQGTEQPKKKKRVLVEKVHILSLLFVVAYYTSLCIVFI